MSNEEQKVIQSSNFTKEAPYNLDVLGLLKSQLKEEYDTLGRVFKVRVYPCGYMTKLAEQLGMKYDNRYIGMTTQYGKIVIGSQHTNEIKFFDGDPFEKGVTNLTEISEKDRQELLAAGKNDNT